MKILESTVLVDLSRQDEMVRAYVDAERKAGVIKVTIVSNMELIIGCRNKAEVQRTEKFLADYEMLDITPRIGRKTYELIVRFNKSHGLAIPDALIAATALVENAVLVTSNTRHFSMIKGLRLEEPY